MRQHASAVARLGQEGATVLRKGLAFQQVKNAEHAVHGRTDLMAHVGQELGLGFRGRLRGAFGLHKRQLLAFAGVDIHDQAGDLLGDPVFVQVRHRASVDPADFASGQDDPPLQLRPRFAGC